MTAKILQFTFFRKYIGCDYLHNDSTNEDSNDLQKLNYDWMSMDGQCRNINRKFIGSCQVGTALV